MTYAPTATPACAQNVSRLTKISVDSANRKSQNIHGIAKYLPSNPSQSDSRHPLTSIPSAIVEVLNHLRAGSRTSRWYFAQKTESRCATQNAQRRQQVVGDLDSERNNMVTTRGDSLPAREGGNLAHIFACKKTNRCADFACKTPSATNPACQEKPAHRHRTRGVSNPSPPGDPLFPGTVSADARNRAPRQHHPHPEVPATSQDEPVHHNPKFWGGEPKRAGAILPLRLAQPNSQEAHAHRHPIRGVTSPSESGPTG
jgi:hypothetical protein